MHATQRMNGRDGLGPLRDLPKEDGPMGEVTAGKLKLLLDRQGYRCALSGRALAPADSQADHITPKKHGGENVMENVQILNCEVNKAKGTLTQEAFIQLCRDVAAHHPAK